MGNARAFEQVVDMFRGNSKQINLVNCADYPRNGTARTKTVKLHGMFYLFDTVRPDQTCEREWIRWTHCHWEVIYAGCSIYGTQRGRGWMVLSPTEREKS